MHDDFPANMKEFIDQHIDSIAQMEALFMLRQEPQHVWTCDELAKRLYITGDMCEAMLADLEQRGFLARQQDSRPTYRFQPVDPQVDDKIAQLAALYQERRVAVITHIYSRPVNKVQTFADAFRLRRDNRS